MVEGGGNLVLTDGALKAVSELTSVPGAAINERVVHVGQTARVRRGPVAIDGIAVRWR